MNISYLKNSWIRFYKRGFMTGLLIMSFILVVDQFLANPLFFSKITVLIFFYLFFQQYFWLSLCGLLSLVFLLVVVIATKDNNS